MNENIKAIMEKDKNDVTNSTNYISTKCEELIEVVKKTYDQMYNNFQNRIIKIKESHKKYHQMNIDLINSTKENIKKELENLNFVQNEVYKKAEKKLRKTIEIDQSELIEKILNHLQSELSTIETKEIVITNTKSINKISEIIQRYSLDKNINTAESIYNEMDDFNNNLSFDNIDEVVENSEKSNYIYIYIL